LEEDRAEDHLMIQEHALLDINPARAAEYEAAFQKAMPLISATPGFLGLTLSPCMEKPGRYLLLVQWETLENHTQDFRGSARYAEWKALLHGFDDPFPEVTHFAEPVAQAGFPRAPE
jgi:heme-degrading monooxygenase HmoA